MDALAGLLARLHTGGQRPFLTFVDGASGERTELGYDAFENWTAKAASYLVAEHGVAAGDIVGAATGDHWITAVIAVSCWRAGAVYAPGGGGRVLLDVEPSPFGWRDVLAYDDHFADVAVRGDVEALPGLSRTAAVAEADQGLDPGARLLCTAPLPSVGGLVHGLLGALLVSGSLVAVTNLDADAIARLAEQEHTSHAV